MRRIPSKPTDLKPQKALLLTAVFLLILSVNFSFVLADSDYVFHNEENDEVHLPQKPVIPIAAPGGLAQKVAFHTPQIQIKSRRDGLEDVRTLVFYFPELPNPDDNDLLKAIYVVDKDGLIVGYSGLQIGQRKAKVTLNGIINYVRIYIECSKHGLWLKELDIPL